MKHLRFIVALFVIPFVNLDNRMRAKWVYIHYSLPQIWLMIYKDMDRIEAADRLKGTWFNKK